MEVGDNRTANNHIVSGVEIINIGYNMADNDEVSAWECQLNEMETAIAERTRQVQDCFTQFAEKGWEAVFNEIYNRFPGWEHRRGNGLVAWVYKPPSGLVLTGGSNGIYHPPNIRNS